jgi:hypothetical protein
VLFPKKTQTSWKYTQINLQIIIHLDYPIFGPALVSRNHSYLKVIADAMGLTHLEKDIVEN